MNALKSVLLALLALFVVLAAVIYGYASDIKMHEQAEDPPVLSEKAKETPVSSDSDTVPRRELSHSKIGWGTGNAVNELNQTVDSISAQNKYSDLGAYFIFPEDDKVIYLTFDLGYENGYTGSILDTLAKSDVKATFFATQEYINQAPLIVERIILEGHTLANHTVKHPSMPDVSDERERSEIMMLHNFVKEKYGYEMTLFRYPMGEFSEHSLELVNTLGYKSIFWSFAYRDWLTDAQPDPTAALNKINSALHPGAIYLLHAVSSTNDAILNEFINQTLARGYRFKLIDERLGLVDSPAPLEDSII
ncbi:MAG: polysaccharide deacetylase family protein [Oscillospiraceae bacterium]